MPYNEKVLEQAAWVDPFAYTDGQPFRAFPLGTFKRGSRTLDITEQRLKDMAANYEAKRPRWEIPIYFGHPTETNPDPPKAGNVKRLEFRAGDGLYVHPEYTDAGKKAVADGDYQYVSPGVLWSLAGGSYADENGNVFDNVIEHVALTNRPFFGSHTQIFSSDAALVEDVDKFSAWLGDMFKDYAAKSDKDDDEETDKEAKAKADAKKGKTMTDNASADAFDAKAKVEELTALLTKQADEFAAEKKRADEFAALLGVERKTRRLSELKRTAEGFANLPVGLDEFAEKFYTLENINADLAKWFADKFSQFDTMVSQGALFSQVSKDNAQTARSESIESVTEKIIADKYKGDRSKYAEAFTEAGLSRPDLVPAELRNLRTR